MFPAVAVAVAVPLVAFAVAAEATVTLSPVPPRPPQMAPKIPSKRMKSDVILPVTVAVASPLRDVALAVPTSTEPPAPVPNMIEIQKLDGLKKAGSINDAEFARLRAR